MILDKDMLDDFNFDEKFGKYSYGKPTKDDCVYKIHVTTSKKASAGTNAQVYIELFGKNERSGKILKSIWIDPSDCNRSR